MIARRHHVDAVFEQLLAYLTCDAETGGGILGVGDDEIDLVIVDERGEPASHELAPWTPDDVADEEDAHRAIMDHKRVDGNAARSPHGDLNVNWPSATVANFRNRNPEFAVCEPRACACRVAGTRETHGARETTEATLDKVKAGIGDAAPHRLFAHNEHRTVFYQHSDGAGLDPRQVDRDLNRIVGFEDIERGRALASEGFESERSAELKKRPAYLVRELSDLRREHDGMYSRTHR